MKVPVISSFLLMLGIASPLLAIERPKALDDQAPEAAPAQAVEIEEPQVEIAPQAPAPWLGVFSQEADEALSAQLGIEGGVVLRFVAEGSPAAAAGLKVHDVVAGVDGKKVATQDELRDAVLQHKPGDDLKMDVVSGGQKREVAVKLGELPADMPQMPEGLIPDAGGRLPGLRNELREFNNLIPGGGEFQKQMEEQMRQMEEQLRKMERQPGLLNLELNELLKDLPKDGNGMNFNLKSSGSVKLLDEKGSVEMKMLDGGNEVEVRDKEGKLLYEGPWDTEQDKGAVDPEMRERIDRLGLNGNGGGLQLHFRRDAEMPAPPAPDAPEAPEAPAAPEAPEAPAAPEAPEPGVE